MKPYETWQDLLDEDDAAPAAEGAPAVASPLAAQPGARPQATVIPEEVARLIAEREALEKKMKAMTGQGEPDPDDERTRAMFPVLVHTKETRIEERRVRRVDAAARLLKQRALSALKMRRTQQRRLAEEQQAQRASMRLVRARALALRERRRIEAEQAALASRLQARVAIAVEELVERRRAQAREDERREAQRRGALERAREKEPRDAEAINPRRAPEPPPPARSERPRTASAAEERSNLRRDASCEPASSVGRDERQWSERNDAHRSERNDAHRSERVEAHRSERIEARRAQRQADAEALDRPRRRSD